MLFIVTWLTLKIVWLISLAVSALAWSRILPSKEEDAPAFWTGLCWIFMPYCLVLTLIFLGRGLWL